MNKSIYIIKLGICVLLLTKIAYADVLEPEMVSLPTGIQMGKYEVTQAQWQSVMGSNPSEFKKCGDNCPVEQVSWEDVQAFVEQINGKTGKHYRLPSEDEWVIACKAGSSSKYCGSDDINAVAWYQSNSNNTTHAVGQKQANAWGLYDMSGNVWEWTSTGNANFDDFQMACFEGHCFGKRVVRGGSWLDWSWNGNVSSADRLRYLADDRVGFIGFRLVLEP